MSASSGRTRRRGFTLTELIVVITVLAVLALLLIPVVAKVRVSAQSTHCTSNLQQIGRAFTLCAQDNKSCLPAPVQTDGTPWYVAIHPYTGTPWRNDFAQLAPVFLCPTWQLDADNTPVAGDIGYAMSAAIGPAVDPGRPVSMPTLQRPTQTVVVLELTGTAFPYFPSAGQSLAEFGGDYVSTFEAHGCDRHSGAANYLFADGHVGHHSPTEAAAFLK